MYLILDTFTSRNNLTFKLKSEKFDQTFFMFIVARYPRIIISDCSNWEKPCMQWLYVNRSWWPTELEIWTWPYRGDHLYLSSCVKGGDLLHWNQPPRREAFHLQLTQELLLRLHLYRKSLAFVRFLNDLFSFLLSRKKRKDYEIYD